MSVPPDQFAHLQGRVDRSGLAGKLVVVIGVGAVGSQVAKELANHAVGRLRLIDHDVFTIENRPRHALPIEYIGRNKAEGMTVYLADQVPGLQSEAVPHRIDDSVSDDLLDRWISDADLIIAATDDREAQRRIGRRALSLDIPALFPGLYEGQGGEVFLQRSPRHPCFFCWDAWRPADQAVHGAAAGNADILEIITLTTQLSLGILDRTSSYARRFLAPNHGAQRPQLFVKLRDADVLLRPSVRKRPNCPNCAVGPAPGNTWTPPPAPAASPPSSNTGVVIAVILAITLVIAIIISAGKNSSPPQASANNATPTTETTPSTGTAATSTTTSPPTTTETSAPSCSSSVECVEQGANAAAGSGNTASPSPTTNPTATTSATSAWTSTMIDQGHQLTSISCPSSSFCAAVDSAGNLFTYKDGAWSSPSPAESQLYSVSCVSQSFCKAVGYGESGGNVYTFNGAAWSSPESLDAGYKLHSISCPTTTFCEVGTAVNVFTVDGTSESGPDAIDQSNNQTNESGYGLPSMSCPSATFCSTIDGSGNAFILTGSSWSTPDSIDHSVQLDSVSCPSTGFCVAVDAGGNAFTYNGSSWSPAESVDQGRQLLSISCTSTSFCATVDANGNILTYNGSSWSSAQHIDQSNQIESVSCASPSFCAAVDDQGNVLTMR